jgi:hypothetical protein
MVKKSPLVFCGLDRGPLPGKGRGYTGRVAASGKFNTSSKVQKFVYIIIA